MGLWQGARFAMLAADSGAAYAIRPLLTITNTSMNFPSLRANLLAGHHTEFFCQPS